MKYFIVDDSAPMREMIKESVMVYGDEAIEFDDGKDITEAYSLHHPDWVLMDIQMKEVNGIEAAKNLKIKFPDAHIILVTQYNDKIFRRRADEVQAEGYVLKENLQLIKDIIYKI